jgi:hypothetical protein
VNDLERDLQEMLHADARRVPTPTSAPGGLRRSVRRRQAVFGSVVGLSALAIVAGIVAGATLLLPIESEPRPGVEGGELRTGTLNGIMITYPTAWYLIDPDTAGFNGPDPSTLPRVVLALSPQPASSAIACPGLTDGEQPAFLMTVQEGPLAADARSVTWPASLEPMNQGTSGSGCYPDWEFLRAGWTIANRTFEARVGFAPDSSDDDRDAVVAAFASMTFAASPEGITSVTLTTGSAGGQEWSLIATREDDGLGLTLQGESSGTGIGAFDRAPQGLQVGSNAFGTGADRELVIFGAVASGVVRVEASSAGGPVVSVDVLDVPTKIDPDLNAFALVVMPGGRIDVRGVDASGNVVIEGTVSGGTAVGAEPPPSAGSALEDGRHFGYVRSVDVDGGAIEFDLAYFLSGEEANQAYQEATGDTGPVPNDHFVVNDNPLLRTLPLAPDTSLRLLDWNNCCDTFFDGDLALFAEAIGEQADVTDGDLIYRGQSQWWITVENGLVTEIEEQYSP